MTDLPERWSDEPWPLDEPDLPSFRPTNWSDTHAEVPQVADLADEAWEYAIDNGVSMERALAELQRREMEPDHDLWRSFTRMFHPSPSGVVYHHTITPTKVASWVPVSQSLLDDPAYHQWRQANRALGSTVSFSVIDEIQDKAAADKLLDDLKRDPMPRYTLDQWTGDDA